MAPAHILSAPFVLLTDILSEVQGVEHVTVAKVLSDGEGRRVMADLAVITTASAVSSVLTSSGSEGVDIAVSDVPAVGGSSLAVSVPASVAAATPVVTLTQIAVAATVSPSTIVRTGIADVEEHETRHVEDLVLVRDGATGIAALSTVSVKLGASVVILPGFRAALRSLLPHKKERTHRGEVLQCVAGWLDTPDRGVILRRGNRGGRAMNERANDGLRGLHAGMDDLACL